MAIDTSIWFRPELGPRLSPTMRQILTSWSGLSDEELLPHLHSIRAQAWPLGEYPCVGMWMFLLPGLSVFPQFPQILAQAKGSNGGLILDLGCGLGQELRVLAAHGVPTETMCALDVRPQLWELGYRLFRDEGRMEASFVAGDVMQVEKQSLVGGQEKNGGKVNLIIAAQFLHLFSWEGQLAATRKIVELSDPGTMVVGYQLGRRRARECAKPWGMTFYQNKESFLQMWEVVQQDTQTKWTVDVWEVELQEWGMIEEDIAWMPEDRMGVNFVITRES